jgi:hypothetical protein
MEYPPPAVETLMLPARRGHWGIPAIPCGEISPGAQISVLPMFYRARPALVGERVKNTVEMVKEA